MGPKNKQEQKHTRARARRLCSRGNFPEKARDLEFLEEASESFVGVLRRHPRQDQAITYGQWLKVWDWESQYAVADGVLAPFKPSKYCFSAVRARSRANLG